MTRTEDHFINAIRQGDPQGLRQIYRDFLPRIAQLVTKNGGSYEDAKDIFQDALMVIHEKCRRQDFTLSSGFFTLFYGICRNLWGNRLQKRSRGEVTLTDDVKFIEVTTTDQLLIEAEKERMFWNAFRQLGPDCRRLLLMFFQKKSMVEIASAMGFASEGYAKKRKFKCKAQLIELIKADPCYRDFLSL